MEMRKSIAALWVFAMPCLLAAGCIRQRMSLPASECGGDIVVHEAHGGSLLVVYSFASGAYSKRVGQLRGNGLEVTLTDSHTGSTVLHHVITEMDFDIELDYSSLDRGVFKEVLYTYDPRAGGETPFLIRTYRRSGRGRYEQSESVVLEGEEGDARRVDDLVREVVMSDCNGAGSVEQMTAMAHLRNIGIDRPEEILRVMSGVRPQLGCGSDDILSLFTRELEQVRASTAMATPGRDTVRGY